MARPCRWWKAALVRAISSSVSVSCRASTLWWDSSVTKTEQVRQALPLSQVCSGGSRHQPLGRNRSARSSRCRPSRSSRVNSTRVPSALSFTVARKAYPPLLVDPTTLDQRLLAEDVLHRAAQRLAAVEHEQDPAGGVHPAVAQVGHQPADYRGVLGGALHHPQAAP